MYLIYSQPEGSFNLDRNSIEEANVSEDFKINPDIDLNQYGEVGERFIGAATWGRERNWPSQFQHQHFHHLRRR